MNYALNYNNYEISFCKSPQSSVEVLRCHAAEYLRSHPDDFLPFLVKEGTGDMYSQGKFLPLHINYWLTDLLARTL